MKSFEKGKNMGLREGDKVYCHTSTYLLANYELYTKGEYYIIDLINNGTYCIESLYICSNSVSFKIDYDKFDSFFYTLKDYRAMKLKNLYET